MEMAAVAALCGIDPRLILATERLDNWIMQQVAKRANEIRLEEIDHIIDAVSAKVGNAVGKVLGG